MKKGFTLIEMLITMSILVIMIGAVIAFFILLYREQATDIIRIRRISVASQAIKKMSLEIRKINRAENAAFPIEDAQEQTLVFYSDVDNDGMTEKIRYALFGTELKKMITEPTGGDPYVYSEPDVSDPNNYPVIIASDVVNGANPVFRYYNKNYTGSGDPLPLMDPVGSPVRVNVTEIKLVEINLDINPDNDYLTQPFHIETKVHPRSLKEFNKEEEEEE